MIPASLIILPTLFMTIFFHGTAGIPPPTPRSSLLANTSVLPPGWSLNPSGGLDCVADSPPGPDTLRFTLLFGPNFTDPIRLTIESCVAFCNQQGSRLAGLKGTECRCSNFLNSQGGFESDPGECNSSPITSPCPGNSQEDCGRADGNPALVKIFRTVESQFNCVGDVWQGGAPLSPSGSWRFSNYYNDSFSARALPQSAINLPSPFPQGNLTVQACVTTCENEGFTIAGVEFGAECFCGHALESNSQPIRNCSLLPPPTLGSVTTPRSLMPCTGNAKEFCGGPDIISIFTLPGTGLVPMIPFDPTLDDYCPSNCPGNE